MNKATKDVEKDVTFIKELTIGLFVLSAILIVSHFIYGIPTLFLAFIPIILIVAIPAVALTALLIFYTTLIVLYGAAEWLKNINKKD